MSRELHVENSRTAFVTLEVEVVVNDRDVVERVTGPGGDEWRSMFYKLYTEQDVIEHLAYNHVANGVYDVSRLEGWGDLDRDAVSFYRASDHTEVAEGAAA